jgi:hypothetical protein
MTSRRDFLKGTGAAGAGIAGASVITGVHAADSAISRYTGPHKMPQNARLLSIRNSDGTETLGAVTDKGVVDIRAAAARLGIGAPLTLDELLQEGNADGLTKVVEQAKSSGTALVDESTITHGRLFARPGKIVCVGLNYRGMQRKWARHCRGSRCCSTNSTMRWPATMPSFRCRRKRSIWFKIKPVAKDRQPLSATRTAPVEAWQKEEISLVKTTLSAS